jgi:hypothetical protein
MRAVRVRRDLRGQRQRRSLHGGEQYAYARCRHELRSGARDTLRRGNETLLLHATLCRQIRLFYERHSCLRRAIKKSRIPLAVEEESTRT